jgi:hypothetical protein
MENEPILKVEDLGNRKNNNLSVEEDLIVWEDK